ncbi:FimD/PapC C-terminal domain-containing protein [Lysobacter sp. ISL-42]|uniref:FimD/PapC C-terminal domain-containing protein n=1 Tax=Lysobacter sp. ISL-42 TaxID=2819152 RepID=UPI0031F30B3C
MRFSIQKIRAAVLILHDAAGQALPVGTRVHGPGGTDAVVGYDGEVYLESLQDHNDLRIDTPAGACRVRFDYPAHAQGIARIGPLSCAAQVSP